MSERPSRVQLPILKQFTIANYQLYPGPDGNGFTATIPKGVSIVLGINGLGKTTLLNGLFRVLSGPTDWASRSFDKPAASTSSDLGKWKTKEYFKKRVPDRAKTATISAVIGFGEDEIHVTRRLSDLVIRSLKVRGVDRPATEATYQTAICDMAHVEAFSEFYLILRYLVFFLEDRQPVVWDKAAQFDILRVLFYDPKVSTKLRDWFSEIQRLDSQYRNKRVPYNLAVNELEELQTAFAAEGEVRAELELLQTRIEASADTENDLLAEDDRLRDELVRRERLLNQQQHSLEERVREHERLEQRYLGELFPALDSVVHYVFGHLASGGGCLLCGNRTADVSARLLKVHEDGSCPVCDSPPDQHEKVVPPKQVADRRLDDVYNDIQEVRRSIAGVKEDIASIQDALEQNAESLRTAQETSARLRRERREKRATLPDDEGQILGLQDFVSRRREELAELERQRKKCDREYKAAHGAQRKLLDDLAARIKERFEYFAGSFLADECRLEYTKDERKIGQQTALQTFPLFTVKLSSGVFHDEVQPREEQHEVSESQKEFIDLAFRMALINVACEDTPSMMVLETPEASLDAVFIMRAGLLLAAFANEGGSVGNRLLASTNLNQSRMVQALLGVTDQEDRLSVDVSHVKPIPVEERAARVIDLLLIAEKNAALKENARLYRLRADQALYPERFVRASAVEAA